MRDALLSIKEKMNTIQLRCSCGDVLRLEDSLRELKGSINVLGYTTDLSVKVQNKIKELVKLVNNTPEFNISYDNIETANTSAIKSTIESMELLIIEIEESLDKDVKPSTLAGINLI